MFGELWNPTLAATKMATELQKGCFDEGVISSTKADGRAVAVATVHTRQDVVLLYAMATAQHAQLVNISRGVWVLALLAAWIVFQSPVRHYFGF